MDKILNLIKQQRLRKGISQAVIGRRLHMVSSAYGKIERGQTDLTVKRLIEICNILDLNAMELTRLFLGTPQLPRKERESIYHFSIQEELTLSRKINYILKELVNSMIDEKYRMIMEDYPYTEFTAEDWWDSLGDNKEDKLGMTEAEFWERFRDTFQMIYKPEDEYKGFERLMSSSSDVFYFFKFGFIEDNDLCLLFQKYMQLKGGRQYPLELKFQESKITEYLLSLNTQDVYAPKPDIIQEIVTLLTTQA